MTLADGRSVPARRLLVTTGLVDELPDVPGLRERWGRDVLHCPYCHGWEVRDQAVGVLASGPMSVHQALLFRQLTADVTLFSHTAPAPTDEQAEQLAARGIAVVDRRGGRAGGRRRPADRCPAARTAGRSAARRVVVAPRFVARAGSWTAWGCGRAEHPSGVGDTSRPTRPAGPTCPACGSRATSPT